MRKYRSVLLVDDDFAVLDSTKQALIQRDYSVFDAEHLDEAIEILRDFSISIDILVTDFNIGKMNGVDLSRLAILLRPRLEILFVSGNPGSQASLRIKRAFLAKTVYLARVASKARFPSSGGQAVIWFAFTQTFSYVSFFLIPQGSPQNRPTKVTSKPANEGGPGPGCFTATCRDRASLF